ncbi:MAG: iron-containing alcohol dehydrogenase, partial [Pseudomonadales bacterium]|nr:iron-containing alcohol dehydrogenase [Pseudomonadales bacterium]
SRGSKFGKPELFSDHSSVGLIAVPTTLSGAEYSNTAGVLDTISQTKEGYRAPVMCAKAIVYDAMLTTHTPEWLFLSTAIRSLDHAIEGYCSADATPFHDGHYLHAMTLFSEALPGIKQEPGNLHMRSLSQHAVWLACCGLGSVSHGASHGIGYILGSLCGVPHGYTSCVMLPAVLHWNTSVLGDRAGHITRAMGGEGSDAASVVKQLIATLGLPTNLQEVGVEHSQLDEIAERVIQHPVVKKNPRPLQSAEQAKEILMLAWKEN